VHSNKGKKLVRTTIALVLTLLLTILNVLTPFIYAAEWSPDTRLTWDKSLDWAPSIAQAKDGRIWIVWHSFEIGTDLDILYKVYNRSSTFPWSLTKKLTTDLGNDMTPSIIATADGKIWVVWSSNRDGNFEIYHKVYDGSSWSPDTRLTANAGVDEFPSIMQDKDGDIWVVWSSNRDGNFEIYHKIYNHTRKEWHPEGLLISNPAMDWDPSIMQAHDGKIWIAWTRENDLFYKVLLKNKTQVIPDSRLTYNETSPHPSIMQAQDGKIWIALESYRLGMDLDIYCKIFNGTWSEKRITYNDADDIMPAIMQTADGTIWIAWTSTRLGNFDIYYKTDSPPQHLHDMAIVSVTHNPNVTQARPGLNISIEVVPQNQGLEPEDFVVKCYTNSTLIGSLDVHLYAGQLMPINFVWRTSGIATGVYTITAQVSIVQGETDTADNTFINGVVLIIIPGDADFSGLVDMEDFYIWRENFGKRSSQIPPGVYPDFDNNGLVEMPDFYIWRKNFGATT